jgi:hypothetical protein
MAPLLLRVVPLLVVGLVVAGCATDSTDDGADESTGASSEDALTSAGGKTTLYYLGSSSFLRQCAGETLGCGRAVSSISNATPYFSAPSSWGRSACNEWYTFRVNGKCVEAQRFEVSDKRNYIEGNPGLFDGLGLAHSDGSHCAGSGTARNVSVTAGRHCD